ncbi:MAG: DUF2934 domain-containing protein [Nitrospira sp.]|nr:DUF2934 domain-containing protein [Nitrospira sp.]
MKVKNLIQERDACTAPTVTDSSKGSDDQHHQRIAAAAFALYEQRGRHDGHDLDDWLAAEQQILLIDVSKPFGVVQGTNREARLQRENARLRRLVGELILELKNDEEVWA